MPITRRGEKAGLATSDGKSQASEESPAGSTADSEIAAQHRDMEDPKDLQDGAVLRLRAAVTASRKLVDGLIGNK